MFRAFALPCRPRKGHFRMRSQYVQSCSANRRPFAAAQAISRTTYCRELSTTMPNIPSKMATLRLKFTYRSDFESFVLSSSGLPISRRACAFIVCFSQVMQTSPDQPFYGLAERKLPHRPQPGNWPATWIGVPLTCAPGFDVHFSDACNAYCALRNRAMRRKVSSAGRTCGVF